MAAKSNGQGDNQGEVMSAASLVTKSARVIVLQEDISTIKQLPDLPQHQQKARVQANNWLNNIWKLIIQSTADIIGYGIQFTAAYNSLLKLVPKLESGDEEAKNDFSEVLNFLLDNLKRKKTTATQIAGDIQTFHDSFLPLYQKFRSDFEIADDIITGDCEEIKSLKRKKNVALVDAKKYEWAAVSAGIALPIIGVSTVVLAETGIGAVIGGILIVADLSAISATLVKYSEAMDKVHKLTRKISKLNQEVSLLQAVENQISELQENSQNCVNASATTRDGWLSLIASMTELINQLADITPQQAAIVIKIQLSAANEDWQNVVQQAKKLQPSGELPTEHFKHSDELVAALKDQAKLQPSDKEIKHSENAII